MTEEKSLKKEIISHMVKFSLGSAIKGLGQFANQYFAALLLGPAVFGAWQSVKIFLSYSPCVGLGSVEGMYKEIPILKGKGSFQKISGIKNTVFIYNILASALAGALIFAVSFFVFKNNEIVLALRFLALIIFLQSFKFFAETWLKANNEFDILSTVAVIDGIGFVISIILIFFFSFLGFLAGYAIIIFVSGAYACFMGRVFEGFRKWDFKIFRLLVIGGFPIMAVGLCDALFFTVDRLLILGFLNTKYLGFYTLGGLIFMPLTYIYYSASSVMFPRLGERFGKSGKDSDLKKFIILPLSFLSLFVLFLAGAVAVILQDIINALLPAYAPGVATAQIMIFGLFFAYSASMIGNFFLATGRQYLYLFLLLSSALANIAMGFLFIKLGFGIEGVAAGSFVSYLALFLSVSFLAMFFCRADAKEAAIFFLGIFLPLIYVYAIFFFIKNFLPANIFIKETVYLLFAWVLLYLLFKKIYHYVI